MARVASQMLRQQVLVISGRCLATDAIAAKKEAREQDLNDARPFDEMPGHRPILPLIGTALRKRDKHIIKDLGNMIAKHGPIFREKVGPMWVVFTMEPADIRQMYRNEGKYPYRGDVMPLEAAYCKAENKIPSLAALDWQEWHDTRYNVQRHLMRKDAALPFLQDQEKVTEDFIERLRKIRTPDGKVNNFGFELNKYALEAVTVLSFDIRLNCLDMAEDSDSQSARYLNSFLEGITCIDKANFSLLRLYKYFPTNLYRTYKAAADVYQSLNEKYFADALRKIELSETDPTIHKPRFINYMMKTKGIDERSARIILTGLTEAGVDSTGTVLSWMSYTLAKNPDKQALVLKEIEEVLPSRAKVDEVSFENMPYLRATLKESFRLNFPFGAGAPRILPKDTVLGGYRVPQGVAITPLMRHMCVSEKYFEDPHKFIPERWLRDDVTGDRTSEIDPFILLPFGHGPRSCLGRRIAEQEVLLAAVKLLQNFRLEYDGEDMDTVVRTFVVMDKPLNMTLIDR